MPPPEVIATEIAHPEKGQSNLIHTGTGFKADSYTTGRDEFGAWALRNARKTEFEGEMITLAPPECVIVRKLEFRREGGSDKHLRDIRTILNISSAQINQANLDEWNHLCRWRGGLVLGNGWVCGKDVTRWRKCSQKRHCSRITKLCLKQL